MAPPISTAAERLNPGTRRRESRGGMTLIELVIVASLLVMLAAIAIPTIRLAVEGRRVREAARTLNVYLGSARNRAMATGRPVGVVLQRFENNGNVCFALDQIETPPPYAGDTINARALVNTSAGTAHFVDGSYPHGALPLPAGRVRVDDKIQFNHQGFWYNIDSLILGADNIINGVNISMLNPAPWKQPPTWPRPVPYEVRSQPGMPGGPAAAFRSSVSKPLQLPLDAVVDLTFSGISGIASSEPAHGHFSITNVSPAPIVIMFAPNGGLYHVYYGSRRNLGTDPVFLLIGKRERVPPDVAEDGLNNLEDLENLWIVISPRTGLVNTVENAPMLVPYDLSDPDTHPINQARRFTSDAQSVGGR